MQKLKPLLLFILLTQVLTAQNFNTQKGWVVKTAGDTVYGAIKDRSNLRDRVLFRPEGGGEFTGLTPGEITAFAFEDGHYYRSVAVPAAGDSTTERVFLKCMAEGYMQLYYAGDMVFYLKKPDNPVARLGRMDYVTNSRNVRDNRYIRTLIFLMQDCPEIPARDIERVSYNEIGLAAIVNRYNRCKNPEGFMPPARKTGWFRPRLGVRLGAVAGNFAYIVPESRQYPFTYSPNWRLAGGLTFNFEINRKLSFQPELLLIPKNAEGFLDTPGSYPYRYETKIDLLILQVPLMLYYHLPTKKLRPFINAGVVAGYILKKDAGYTLGRDTKFEIKNDEIGVIRGGGGLTYMLNKSTGLSLEYTHERTIINRIHVTNKIRSVSNYLWLRVQTDLHR